MIIKKPFRRVLGVVLCCMAGAFISGCSHQEDYQRAPVHMVPATMDSTLIYYLPCDDGLHVRRCEMKTAARDNTPVEALREMVRADKRQDNPLLPDGLSVNYVVVEHGIAYADFSAELALLNESSSVQELFVHMTVDTLTEFPDIQTVVIQVEGQAPHIPGNIDWSTPFSRDTQEITAAN